MTGGLYSVRIITVHTCTAHIVTGVQGDTITVGICRMPGRDAGQSLSILYVLKLYSQECMGLIFRTGTVSDRESSFFTFPAYRLRQKGERAYVSGYEERR